MKKPVVVIIKANPWQLYQSSKTHPEYLAIFNTIKNNKGKTSFVLTGTSNDQRSYLLKDDVVAWDLPIGGIVGTIGYSLRLIRIFFQYRPRLIIILGLHQLLPALMFCLISPRSKCSPIFIGELGYYGTRTIGKFFNYTQFKLLSLVLRVSYTRMSRMFALSRYIRDALIKMAPVLKGKITLISYPISPAFNSQKTRKHTASDVPAILTVAGIDPRKGLDVLIKAVSMIPLKKRPKVIIKGQIRNPSYMEMLNKMILELKLRETVTFITENINYEDLVSYYQSATLFVFPTREDSLGVVLLEALHSNLPIIASSVGGVVDMIKNGENGILVKPNDPIQLANAILQLLNDDALRTRIAKNSEHFLQDYYKRITLDEAFEKSIEAIF
jgi:glycosyltransferase involved in cell wall biosynthesis